MIAKAIGTICLVISIVIILIISVGRSKFTKQNKIGKLTIISTLFCFIGLTLIEYT